MREPSFPFSVPLPIDNALPALLAALKRHMGVVLVAPPGAGKTTRVPLALLNEDWTGTGRILVLEPRRLAARAAASRMAQTLREDVGGTVGLRVRFGSKVSARTRIEVITEGVFTRLILEDPTLAGVCAVIFDEFHERSLDADLGLALALDAQRGLREDLRVLVMSATLDGARVASLLGSDAPVIESEGRAFAVETRYAGRDPRLPVEAQMASLIGRALRAETGSVLAFLPGAAEINRTASRLRDEIADKDIEVHTLFGALDQKVQDAAIAPARAPHRKVVLATSIAETSLTIEGVRVVVDSGLSRVPRFEPDVGLTRLETVRVSRAAADQRRGRAGRTEPGVCYRLWEEPQTAALEAYSKPEILAADLSGFLLDLAQWGVSDPAMLAFLDAPPSAAVTEARALLRSLDAIDADGRLTDEGRLLRRLPLPPRLARMVVDAAREGAAQRAAEIAVLLTERGLGGNDADLTHRLDALRRDRSPRAEDARAMARRWAALAAPAKAQVNPRVNHDVSATSVGALLALAYPDRIAKSRGNGGAFVLANGRGAQVDAASALAREPFLAVAEISGTAAQGRILLAAPLTLSEIEMSFAGDIADETLLSFDRASASVRARRRRRLGTLTLAEQTIPVPAGEETARVLAEGIKDIGIAKLPWTAALSQWRDRVMFLRHAEGQAKVQDSQWPDLSDTALTETLADWLSPYLGGKTSVANIAHDELENALHALVPFALARRLDAEAPTHFAAPSGSRVPIDYDGEDGPRIEIRVQELFGLDRHPSIAGGRIALIVALLSPARRPVQVTRDLPGFWRGSYAAVKTEMKGRYPRHPWPDDPRTAPPTTRVKPRGT